jgi:hypothetical protein
MFILEVNMRGEKMSKKVKVFIMVLILFVTGVIIFRIQLAKNKGPELEQNQTDLGIPVKVANFQTKEMSQKLDYS